MEQVTKFSEVGLKKLLLLFFIAILVGFFSVVPARNLSSYGKIYLKMAGFPLASLKVVENYESRKEVLKTLNPDLSSTDADTLMRENARLRIGLPMILHAMGVHTETGFILLHFGAVVLFCLLLSLIACSVFSSSIAAYATVVSIATSTPIFWNIGAGIGYADIFSYCIASLMFCLMIYFKRFSLLYTCSMVVLGTFSIVVHEANIFLLMTLPVAYLLIFPKSKLNIYDLIIFVSVTILSALYILANLTAWKLHSISLAGSKPISFLLQNPTRAFMAVVGSFAFSWIFFIRTLIELYEKGRPLIFALLLMLFFFITSQLILAVDASRLMGGFFLIIALCSGLTVEKFNTRFLILIGVVSILVPKYIIGTNSVWSKNSIPLKVFSKLYE